MGIHSCVSQTQYSTEGSKSRSGNRNCFSPVVEPVDSDSGMRLRQRLHRYKQVDNSDIREVDSRQKEQGGIKVRLRVMPQPCGRIAGGMTTCVHTSVFLYQGMTELILEANDCVSVSWAADPVNIPLGAKPTLVGLVAGA
jgi:hypothetical protein